jgi:branched-chain amino acid transport system substrate-binding protein
MWTFPLLPGVVRLRYPFRILPRARPSVKAACAALVPLAVAVVGTVACSTHALQRADPRVIRIASQSPFSERYLAEGQALMLAVRLAVAELGGALRKYGLVVEVANFDDQASIEQAVRDARYMAADAGILAVVGPLTSDVALEVAPIYHEAGLAMISPSSTHPDLTSRGMPNVFRVCGRDDVQADLAARFIRQSLGARTVYVVHDGTTYGRGNAKFFRAAATRRELALVGDDRAEAPVATSKVAAAVAAAAPDVLYFAGSSDIGGPLFMEARRAGAAATFVGSDGIDSSALLLGAGEAAVGAYYTSVAGAVAVHPQARGFTYEYRKTFDRYPEPFAAQAYDAAAVVLEAIARAARRPDGVTRATVTAALRETRYLGYSGPIAFDERGDLRRALYLVMKVSARDPDDWDDNRELKRIGISPPPR